MLGSPVRFTGLLVLAVAACLLAAVVVYHLPAEEQLAEASDLVQVIAPVDGILHDTRGPDTPFQQMLLPGHRPGVRAGDRVYEGQVLARLEGAGTEVAELRVRVVEAEQAVAEAQRRYDTMCGLSQTRICLSLSEVRAAKLAWDKQASELGALREALRRAEARWQLHDIRSPVDGFVEGVARRTGDAVKQWEPILYVRPMDGRQSAGHFLPDSRARKPDHNSFFVSRGCTFRFPAVSSDRNPKPAHHPRLGGRRTRRLSLGPSPDEIAFMSSPAVSSAPSVMPPTVPAGLTPQLSEEARRALLRAHELVNLHKQLKGDAAKHREQLQLLAKLNQQVEQKSRQLKYDEETHARDKAEWAQLTEKWSRERETWSQQLAAYAAGKDTLARQQAEVAREREAVARFHAEKDALARQKVELDKLRADLARERHTLEEQHTACATLQTDLAQQWQALMQKEAAAFRSPADTREEPPGLQHWVAERAALEARLAAQADELEQLRMVVSAPHVGGDAGAEIENLTNQLEELKQSQAREKKNWESQRTTLRDEIKALRQQLDEELALIERLQSQPAPAAAAVEPVAEAAPAEEADYEAELTAFRQELEADRRDLEQEVQELRQRKEEFDVGARTTELEMSQERAMLSRERSRLDRLREELRMEMEQVRREGDFRAGLGAVNRLTDEHRAQTNNKPRRK